MTDLGIKMKKKKDLYANVIVFTVEGQTALHCNMMIRDKRRMTCLWLDPSFPQLTAHLHILRISIDCEVDSR